MNSIKSVIVLVLLISNQIISLHLDTKYLYDQEIQFQQKNYRKSNANKSVRNTGINSGLNLNDLIRATQTHPNTRQFNGITSLFSSPNVNDTIANSPEYERRRKAINDFAVTVLKNVQKFANVETKKKIEKFLKEQEKQSPTTSPDDEMTNVEDFSAKGDVKTRKEIERQKEYDQFPPFFMMNDKFIGNHPTAGLTSPRSSSTQMKSSKKDPMDDVIVQLRELIKKEIIRLDELNRLRRQDGDEEEDDDGEDEAPGGLTGLIASLSGGEDGSDVGALVGAIASLITNLFGPDGLDVASLLSTGTSLIAGLLGGDEGFGRVLAGYIGTAVDGLSGGGGAELNGQFFGNFIGALLASLSADPDEDSEELLPPKPFIFLENLITSFHEANRKNLNKNDEGGGGHKGSDSFSFISHIVSSIVAGVTNVIVNGSLGSSGGSSQGSVSASGASSHDKHPMDGGGGDGE